MTDNEVTLGEVYRGLQRVEMGQRDLAARFDDLGPLSVEVAATKLRLDKLEPRVDNVVINAAYVAGGVAAMAWLVSLIWK